MAEPLPFETVYERFSANIHRFCLSQLRDPSAAEDVAAEVFISAYAAYGRAHPPPDAVLYWLLRIAKNQVIDHQRRSARWRTILTTLRREPQQVSDVEAVADVNETMRTVLIAMQTLPPRDRLLVGLRYAADLPFDEIGQLTGMSSRAAAMATYRAMERLRGQAGDAL